MIIDTVYANSSAPLLTIRKVRRNRLNSEVFSVDMALDMRMIDGNDCDGYDRIGMSK